MLTTLIVLTGASILTMNMFVPSLDHMAADFDVSYGTMNLAVGGYLFTTAVMQLIFGPLSDRYGRRPLILIGTGVFIAASLVCTITSDFTVFMIARLLQASSAAGLALSRAIVRDQYEGNEVAQKMATIALVMALAPMLGPMAGGMIDEWVGWRGTFAVYTVMGLALFALAWVDLGETNTALQPSFKAQFATYPELFTSRRFWGYSVCWAFTTASFHVFISGAPISLAGAFGMSPATLGMWMGMMTLGFMIGTWVAGQEAKRSGWQLTSMMILGRALGVVTLAISLVLMLAGMVSVPVFFFGVLGVGISIGLTSPNAATGVMSVRPHLAGSASGLSSAMITAAGGLCATVTGALVSPEFGVFWITGLLLVATLIGLIAAIWVRNLEARQMAEAA